MTQEETMQLAKEAGLKKDWFVPWDGEDEAIQRFAALVAARERESCALVCDAKAHEVRLWCNESNVIACAAAIRARGQKE